MKCVCGYEYETKLEEARETMFGMHRDTTIVKGDIPFKQIKVGGDKDNPYFYIKDEAQPKLYACPKCGTLKIEV